MGKKWNELSTKEKLSWVAYGVLGVISAVFVVADLAGLWEHAEFCWRISVGCLFMVECAIEWNKNRKMAILELIGGVILFGIAIAGLFI